MTLTQPTPFTFAALDELAFAAAQQCLPSLPVGSYRFDGIGPVLELARLSRTGLLPPPTGADWLALEDATGIADALRYGRQMWTCRERKLGYLRMQAEAPKDDTKGNAFMLEAQIAANSVGFPPKLAAALAGAFEESLVTSMTTRPEQQQELQHTERRCAALSSPSVTAALVC